MPLSAYALDNFIAPKLSLLNVCNAPDVAELPNYHGSLVLNQMLFSIYAEPVKVLLLNFVRRLDAAIGEYRSGRDYLMQYLSTLPDHRELDKHNRALAHFEDCIINGYIAIVCLNGLGTHFRRSDPSAPAVFIPGDGSDYDRLRKLNNRIKHFDEDVEKAVASGSAATPLAPVWITNDGLEASTASLSFIELADILTAQAKDAKSFSEEIFTEVAERRKQQQS